MIIGKMLMKYYHPHLFHSLFIHMLLLCIEPNPKFRVVRALSCPFDYANAAVTDTYIQICSGGS